MAKRSVPGIFTMTIADCFCGGVAAILVCTFLMQTIQMRQRSELLVQNNLILNMRAVGYGKEDAMGKRQSYPIKIAAELRLPQKAGHIPNSTEPMLDIPRDLSSYKLRLGAGGIAEDFCEVVELPAEYSDTLFVRFQMVNVAKYPRCILSVYIQDAPPADIDYIEFTGMVIDPGKLTRGIDEALLQTLPRELLEKEYLVTVPDALVVSEKSLNGAQSPANPERELNAVRADTTKSLAQVRLYFRCFLEELPAEAGKK